MEPPTVRSLGTCVAIISNHNGSAKFRVVEPMSCAPYWYAKDVRVGWVDMFCDATTHGCVHHGQTSEVSESVPHTMAWEVTDTNCLIWFRK